jgi:hypothetical protein
MKNHFKKIIQAILIVTFPNVVIAMDDGPRMYWNGPVGLNIMQTYAWSIHGNTISENGAIYDPDIVVDMEVMLIGYNRIFDLYGHSFIFTTMLAAGHASATILNHGTQSTRGLGDLYFQGTFNLIGAPAISASEFANYKQETVLSLLLGVSTPTEKTDGDYV